MTLVEGKTAAARVFISYSRDDNAFVDELRNGLQSHGIKVWLDRTDTAGGTNWEAAIAEAVQGCDALVAVLSPDAVASSYVPTELSLAREMRRRIIPLIHRRAELSPQIRFLVSGLQYIDFEDLGFEEGMRRLLAALAVKVAEPPARTLPRWRRPSVLVAGGTALAALTIGMPLVVGRLRPTHVASRQPMTAPTAAPLAVPGIAGYWRALVTYGANGTFEERFALIVEGNRLVGTASLRGYGNRRGILRGTVTGDALSFVTKGRVQDDLSTVRDVTNEYAGTLVGSEIRFTLQEERSGDPPVEFVARPISRAEFDRVATGGTDPERIGGDAGDIYDWDHIDEVLKTQDKTIRACYVASEFDPVDHELVYFRLTLDRAGGVERVEPPGTDQRSAALDACMDQALRAVRWGPTKTGQGGSMVLGFAARLPWNR